MALINVESVLLSVKQHLKKCSEGEGIEIMSYKRNRSIAVIALDGSKFEILEKGYVEARYQVEQSELDKKMKVLLKREFPRSRKLRIFKFTAVEQLNRIHQKI